MTTVKNNIYNVENYWNSNNKVRFPVASLVVYFKFQKMKKDDFAWKNCKIN